VSTLRKAPRPPALPPEISLQISGQLRVSPERLSLTESSCEVLSQNLKSIIESEGWTQKEIAEAAGLPRTRMSKIVNNKTVEYISWATVVKIADALSCDPVDLLTCWSSSSQAQLTTEARTESSAP
jgi:DNA-binding Xre family transcriptional regulator